MIRAASRCFLRSCVRWTKPESARAECRAVSAAAAARAFGYEPKFIAVSTDANVPMSLGIPAIAIGSGASGGREHSPDEYIDVAPAESVRGMTVGLATVLAAAGGISK